MTRAAVPGRDWSSVAWVLDSVMDRGHGVDCGRSNVVAKVSSRSAQLVVALRRRGT